MIILQVILTVVAAFYILWVIYLAVMNLARVKNAHGLSKPVVILGTPLLFIGYLLDALLNWIVMTVILLEIPKETTVSERLKRHNKAGGWRGKIAAMFEPILDPFDPSGDHI